MTQPKVTSPRHVSAPLPDSFDVIDWPTPTRIVDEIRRAAMELMWGLHRQRAAWAHFAAVRAGLDERNITYVDNERAYTLASGNVKWWRAEVSSRASALAAMLELAKQVGLDIGDFYDSERRQLPK